MKNLLYFMSSLTMEEVFIVTGVALVLIAVAYAILESFSYKYPDDGYGLMEDEAEEEV